MQNNPEFTAQDTMDSLRGKVKLVDLNQELADRLKRFTDFCYKHYTADDLKAIEARRKMWDNWDSSEVQLYFEPTFAPGKKRRGMQNYEALQRDVLQMERLMRKIVEMAFDIDPDADDHWHNYQIAPIIIRTKDTA